jgi:phosphoribosylcarboxyaminoimidazole (NCAIR) mutase
MVAAMLRRLIAILALASAVAVGGRASATTTPANIPNSMRDAAGSEAARDVLGSAAVVIVVAGMEGALPSVVGGLVSVPVIAVPTSVGYGAAFGGLSALLGMLNSCASGVTVVNIDNGFGAAAAASRINLLPPS